MMKSEQSAQIHRDVQRFLADKREITKLPRWVEKVIKPTDRQVSRDRAIKRNKGRTGTKNQKLQFHDLGL
jgi:hypothetical protein